MTIPENVKYDSKEKKECIEFLKEHFLSYHVILNKELYPELRYVAISDGDARKAGLEPLRGDNKIVSDE